MGGAEAKDVPPPPFGALLKHYRRRAQLNQAGLAKGAGYSDSHISMLERGERLPTPTTVDLLAQALDLEPHERTALHDALRRARETAIEQDWSAQAFSASPPGALSPVARGDSSPPAWPVGGFLGAAPEAPLVAREEELVRVDATLAAVEGGAGRLVVLAGEAGIGKTRLAQEVAQRAWARGMLVATGRCYEPQQAIAYYPFVEALDALYREAPAHVQADAPKRWPEALRLLPERDASSAVGAGGGDGQQRLLWQVTGFLQTVAAVRPVALLVDDLHWVDEASLALVQHLARQTRGDRLLLVGTYRDNELRRQRALRSALHELERERLLERVAVRRFDTTETAALVGALLGSADAAADSLVELVQGATAGNPFFTREMLLTLRARGDLALQAGRWQTRRAAESALALPDTVRTAIAERVARLSSLAQAALQAASVLGEVFGAATLQRMGEWTEAEVEEALEAALLAALLGEAGRGDYRFAHALTQRAVYAEIPPPRRRRLHRAAGEALERAGEQARLRQAARLARHFLEGDAIERALPYALLAGGQAARLYAWGEAERAYRLAIELAREVGDHAREAEALEWRAHIWYRLGNYAEAMTDLDAAITLYRRLGDWEGLVWATTAWAKAGDPLGHAAASLARIDDLVTTLAAQVDRRVGTAASGDHEGSLEERMKQASTILTPFTAARLYTSLTARMVILGRYDEALWTSEQAIASLARVDPAEARSPERERLLALQHPLAMGSIARSFRAYALHARERPLEAVATLEDAATLARECQDIDALFMTLGCLAEIRGLGGEIGEAKRIYLEVLGVARERGDTPYAVATECAIGSLALIAGDWAEARQCCERAALELDASVPMQAGKISDAAVQQAVLSAWLDLLTGHETVIGPPPIVVLGRALEPDVDDDYRLFAARALAEQALVAGNAREASAIARSVLDGTAEDSQHTPGLRALLAWAELELGHESQAIAIAAQARRSAEARRNRLALVDILRIQALIAMRQGRWEEATNVLDETLALSCDLRYPYAEAKARYTFGHLHVAEGEPLRAREDYEAALALCDRLGEGLYRPHITKAFVAAGGVISEQAD